MVGNKMGQMGHYIACTKCVPFLRFHQAAKGYFRILGMFWTVPFDVSRLRTKKWTNRTQKSDTRVSDFRTQK